MTYNWIPLAAACCQLVACGSLWFLLLVAQVCLVRSKQLFTESWQPQGMNRLSETPWAVGGAPAAEAPSLAPALEPRYDEHEVQMKKIHIYLYLLSVAYATNLTFLVIVTDWTWGDSSFLDIKNSALQLSFGACQKDHWTPPVVLPWV